jgi:hypothetical protein
MLKGIDPPPGWTVEEFARYKEYMGEKWLPPPGLEWMSARIGDNGPPPEPPTDPGPDETYRISLPIPEYVPKAAVSAFLAALREQGPYPDRLAAIEQSVARVRAEKSVQHAEFRLYQGVADTAKGEHRCSILDLDKLSCIVGIGDPSNLSKIAKRLEDSGRFAVLRYTEGKLKYAKSRKILIAPIVTAEDRAKASVPRILAQADATKASELVKRAEIRRIRYRDKGTQDSVVVPTTTTNCRGDDNHDNGLSWCSQPSCRGDEYPTLIPHKNTTKEGGADAPVAPATNGKSGRAAMAATLNPNSIEVLAGRSIIITKFGFEIGQELRDELRKTYTDEQINAAIDCTLAACPTSPTKVQILQQLKRQCVYRKGDDAKAAKRQPPQRRNF